MRLSLQDLEYFTALFYVKNEYLSLWRHFFRVPLLNKPKNEEKVNTQASAFFPTSFIMEPIYELASELARLHGVDSTAFVPAVFPSSGRGVAAARDLQAGSEFLRVPESALLSANRLASISPLGLVLAASGPHAMRASAIMSAILAYERDRDTKSPFYTYIRTLPTSLPTVAPKFAEDGDAMELLGDSQFACAAKRQLEEQTEDFAQIVSLLRERDLPCVRCESLVAPGGECRACSAPSWTLKQHSFAWAYSCVYTRSLYVHAPKSVYRNDDSVLCPLGDLCNFSHHGGSAAIEAATGDMVFRTGTAVKKGEEVTLCYDQGASNSTLLDIYGFVLRPNPHDSLQLTQNDLRLGDIASLLEINDRIPLLESIGAHGGYSVSREGVSWSAAATVAIASLPANAEALRRADKLWEMFASETTLPASATSHIRCVLIGIEQQNNDRLRRIEREISDAPPSARRARLATARDFVAERLDVLRSAIASLPSSI